MSFFDVDALRPGSIIVNKENQTTRYVIAILDDEYSADTHWRDILCLLQYPAWGPHLSLEQATFTDDSGITYKLENPDA